MSLSDIPEDLWSKFFDMNLLLNGLIISRNGVTWILLRKMIGLDIKLTHFIALCPELLLVILFQHALDIGGVIVSCLALSLV